MLAFWQLMGNNNLLLISPRKVMPNLAHLAQLPPTDIARAIRGEAPQRLIESEYQEKYQKLLKKLTRLCRPKAPKRIKRDIPRVPMSREELLFKHVWRNIIQRCNNPKDARYPNYGGRGIKVSEAWLDYAQFKLDMWPKPARHLSVDRIDNDGDYSKENCRWSTQQDQALNTRKQA